MPYAPVNDLSMYYEVHGDGPPLVLLHGAYLTAETMAPLAAGLAERRQVIVPELQAHGRTADIDRPLSYEQMAIRHPALLRRLVVISAGFRSDAMPAEAIEMFPSITPEMFAGSPREAEYQRLAPHPEDFPTLVEKLTTLHTTGYAWPDEDIR